MATVAEMPATYEVRSEPVLNHPSGEPVTPLMLACQQDDLTTVQLILSKQPEAARDTDRRHKTALHHCADAAGVACAQHLLQQAPELADAMDEEGHTALHLAVIAGNRALVRLLLERGADKDTRDHEKHSALHWATVCGELEILDLLLAAGADPSTPDIHGAYPIHYAAQMCGPNSEMATDVRIGMQTLKRLVESGVDVSVTDQDGRQALLWAASAETRPSKTYCPSGSADALVLLVNSGANVSAADKDGLTALHCAASRGHTDCIDTLTTLCGADVDVMDSNGCTPLFYAVTLGHADCTELLLKSGAEPNRQDRKGRTPAHCGAAKGQIETVKLLGRHRANLWIRNVKGDQPLHEAVQSGRKELVRWLLQQRPEAVNQPNNDGRCPLHTAAISNNIEMCKVLMDLHAHVNPIMRSSKGQLMTPLDSALYRGNRSCAKYLQLHGGAPASTLTDQSSLVKALSQNSTFGDIPPGETYTIPPDTRLNLDALHSGRSTQRRSAPSTGVNSPTRDVTYGLSDVTGRLLPADVMTSTSSDGATRRSTEHMGVQVEMPELHAIPSHHSAGALDSRDDHASVGSSSRDPGRREPRVRRHQRQRHHTEEVSIRHHFDDENDSTRPEEKSGSRRKRPGKTLIREESEDDVQNVEVVRRRLRREHNTRYVDERYETEDEQQQSQRESGRPVRRTRSEQTRGSHRERSDESRGSRDDRGDRGSSERHRRRRRRYSSDGGGDYSSDEGRRNRRRRHRSGSSDGSGSDRGSSSRHRSEGRRHQRGYRLVTDYAEPRRHRRYRQRSGEDGKRWRRNRRSGDRYYLSDESDDVSSSYQGSVASERPMRHHKKASRLEERSWSEAGGGGRYHQTARRSRRRPWNRHRSQMDDISSDELDERSGRRRKHYREEHMSFSEEDSPGAHRKEGERLSGHHELLESIGNTRSERENLKGTGKDTIEERTNAEMLGTAEVETSIRTDSGIASEDLLIKQQTDKEMTAIPESENRGDNENQAKGEETVIAVSNSRSHEEEENYTSDVGDLQKGLARLKDDYSEFSRDDQQKGNSVVISEQNQKTISNESSQEKDANGSYSKDKNTHSILDVRETDDKSIEKQVATHVKASDTGEESRTEETAIYEEIHSDHKKSERNDRTGVDDLKPTEDGTVRISTPDNEQHYNRGEQQSTDVVEVLNTDENKNSKGKAGGKKRNVTKGELDLASAEQTSVQADVNVQNFGTLKLGVGTTSSDENSAAKNRHESQTQDSKRAKLPRKQKSESAAQQKRKRSPPSKLRQAKSLDSPKKSKGTSGLVGIRDNGTSEVTAENVTIQNGHAPAHYDTTSKIESSPSPSGSPKMHRSKSTGHIKPPNSYKTKSSSGELKAEQVHETVETLVRSSPDSVHDLRQTRSEDESRSQITSMIKTISNSDPELAVKGGQRSRLPIRIGTSGGVTRTEFRDEVEPDGTHKVVRTSSTTTKSSSTTRVRRAAESKVTAGDAKTSPAKSKTTSSLAVTGSSAKVSGRLGSPREFHQVGRVATLERDLSQLNRPRQDKEEQEDVQVGLSQTGNNPLRFPAEKRILQDLLELKRVQMRTKKTNEENFVKRLSDNFNLQTIRLGLKRFMGPFTYRQYEAYLNDQLRHLQFSPRGGSTRSGRVEDLTYIRRSQKSGKAGPDALNCHQKTYRCHHAAHAYTGIPCVAYRKLAQRQQHGSAKLAPRTILPKISSPPKSGQRPLGDLKGIDSSRPLRLELNSGADKETFELPTGPLDRNKRYQVSFSIRSTTTNGGTLERARSAEDRAETRSPVVEEAGETDLNGATQSHTHAISL